MPSKSHPLAESVAVRFGAVPVHVVGAKPFQSKSSVLFTARFPSSSSNPDCSTTPNAATCQPTTSAAMTPITNNHLVRLLTTLSPTHYLLSLRLGSCRRANAYGTVELTYLGPVP